MNYYEHHLGDYLRDAGHLSMLEDGAYRRLIDAYYIREQALPGDVRECCKLAKATTKAERDAVAYVLREFFVLVDGGYKHRRCEKEIARFKDKQAKAARSANARWAKEGKESEGNANASADAMRTHSGRNALQTPDKEQKQKQFQASLPDLARADPPAGPPAGLPVVTPPAIPTDAGIACRLMREAGCTQTNPGHRDLLAALAEGCTPAELAATAAEAIAAGVRKPFPWAIATARGRRAEGPKPAPTGAPRHDHHHRGSRRPSLAERAQQHEREAHAREAAAAARRADGDPLAPDDRGLRPPLDGCARRVG